MCLPEGEAIVKQWSPRGRWKDRKNSDEEGARVALNSPRSCKAVSNAISFVQARVNPYYLHW